MLDKNLIDFVLRYRNELREAINEEKENRDAKKVGGNGSRHCRISDPTAQKAIRHIDPLGTVKVFYGPKINGLQEYRLVPDSERWLSISEATWKFFEKDRCHKLMVLKYSEGVEDIYEIRKKMRIGRRRYFYMLASIRSYAYKSAKGMHLPSADVRKRFSRTEEILKLLKKKEETT